VHRFGAACTDGAAASGCADMLTGNSSQPLLQLSSPAISGNRAVGSNNAPIADYYVVAPECASGWTLLGE